MLAREVPSGTTRKLTREANRLGSTVARLKLKGIDGRAHNQWSMWFNSIRTEGPYPDLTSNCNPAEMQDSFEGVGQVLHGCRQLVPWGVLLSEVTSATPAIC